MQKSFDPRRLAAYVRLGAFSIALVGAFSHGLLISPATTARPSLGVGGQSGDSEPPLLGDNARVATAMPMAPQPPSQGSASGPGRLAGAAHVVDGDTIDVGTTRVRLEGIDAPEAQQSCETRDRRLWDCGTVATRRLAAAIEGRAVVCATHGADKYGRTLATCYLGGRDVNAAMVEAGLAWAFVKYSSRYVAEEVKARRAGVGVWQGVAQAPWVFRATRWSSASEAAPTGCPIKGNVSASGRIYHMPWSPWYEKVVMRADKGTRWFCSEGEAIAAGWRPVQGR
jgi:endonuclease YncB( thermonuclease family)